MAPRDGLRAILGPQRGRRAGGFLALAAACATACGPEVAPAPFHVLPDTVAAGNLLGPFDGQVADADSGKPVAGAWVDAVWAVEAGAGVASPAGATEVVVQTDDAGRYAVPAFSPPGARALRIARFTLVIYKHGYVGYRSDRRFPDLSPRFDFAQHGNRVSLVRWSGDLGHAKHLEFLGGTRVREAAAWEAEYAALELSGMTPEQATAAIAERSIPALAAATKGTAATTAPSSATAPARPLDAAPLLSTAEIRQVTGFQGELSVEPLTDRPATPTYASLHFRAEALPERYDIALRVWKVAPASAQRQYAALSAELPKAQVTDEIGNRSVRAAQDQILAELFLEARAGVVVLVTCGTAQCHNSADVLRLARIVDRHVPELFGQPAAAPAEPIRPLAPASPASAPRRRRAFPASAPLSRPSP